MMLRAVAAQMRDACTERIYRRGMKDLGLTMEFMQKGGTEFACMSTSASQVPTLSPLNLLLAQAAREPLQSVSL